MFHDFRSAHGLEVKLQSELQQARIARLQHLAKGRIRKITVRIHELRLVKHVKDVGAKLEILWRYEQYFYSGDGWANGFMTREGSTGLIRVDIRL